MSIEVRYATDEDVEQWDDLVSRSPQATPFHLYGFIETLADHSNSTLHPLVGYKGQEPVGVFPAFEIARGPVSTLFSPTPNMKIPYLGPALVDRGQIKQRKAEKDHSEFVEKSLEVFERECAPKSVHVRIPPSYEDVRPFIWEGFEPTAGYTYHVDLTVGEEDLLAGFSSDARRNVRSMEDADCEVRESDADAIEPVITQLKDRHDEQNEHYRVTSEFVVDLYDRMPAGAIRPYTCLVDGEFTGGMIALELGDTVYRWQGGAKTDVDVPVNDYLDWTIMREAIDRGLTRYDMVGANNERLTRYKAKFNPEPAVHLTVYDRSPTMALAAEIYKRFR